MLWLPAIYVIFSVLAFVAYGIDKRAARRHTRRTPEVTLLLLGLLGGWPGALVAQLVLRHKTAKVSFQVVFWLTVALNVAAAAFIVSRLSEAS